MINNSFINIYQLYITNLYHMNLKVSKYLCTVEVIKKWLRN